MPFGGPYDKDHKIWLSILGSILGNYHIKAGEPEKNVLRMLIHDRNSCADMNTSEPRSFKACKSMTAFTVYPKRNSAVGSTKMSTNSALLIAPPPDLSTAPCARCSENYADTSQLLVHFRAFLWLLPAWQPTEGAWNEHIAWPS